MIQSSGVIDGQFNTASCAPQDYAREVRPVEIVLQESLDPALSIVWNPQARLARPGSYDVFGHVIPAVYEGRWQVGLKGKLDGEWTVLHTLGSELGPEKPYRAVGWWLVDFLREWDTANVETVRKIHEALDRNERLDALRSEQRDAETEEQTHRYATDVLGMKTWIGKGTTFTPSLSPTGV